MFWYFLIIYFLTASKHILVIGLLLLLLLLVLLLLLITALIVPQIDIKLADHHTENIQFLLLQFHIGAILMIIFRQKKQKNIIKTE